MKDIIIYKEKVEDDKLDICKYIWKYDKLNSKNKYKCILCKRKVKILLYTFIDKSVNIYLPYCGYYCSINNIYITEISDFLKTNKKYINKIENKTKIIYLDNKK